MSKRAGLQDGSRGDEPSQKRCRIDEGNEALPPTLFFRVRLCIEDQWLLVKLTCSEILLQIFIPPRLGRRRWRVEMDICAFENHTKNSFILDMAKVGDDNDNDDDKEEEEEEEGGRTLKVMPLAGPSAKQKLAATFDQMAAWFEQNLRRSPQDREDPTHKAPETRMYLVHVQRTTTEYITKHLWKKGFPMTISAWAAGQLYVVAGSPKTIGKSLPLSLYLAVKQYTHIVEEECQAVKCSPSELPNPLWVRIKNSPYRGNIALVFEQLPNGIVAVLIVLHTFPYAMPRRSRALIERSRLPSDRTVSDIIRDDEVVGWKFKGESYYMGLLLKNFHHDRLELVASPHISNISLYLDSGWDKPFMKESVVAFLMQFLCMGDLARVVRGSLCGELGKVVSTDHTIGSVEVSKYYLDRRPLTHTLTSRLPMQQYFEPSESDSIQIRDYIEVQEGEHRGKHGVVDWCAKGDTNIWFQDIFTPKNTELSSISVPAAIVQWTDLTKTIQYMKERGYDVRPGDVMTVVRGLEYEAQGVVQHVDFPNARLVLMCDGNHSLLNILIGFVRKVRNADLDHLKKDIGKEVFIIGGDQKGFQGTLYSLAVETCTIAVYGQKRIKPKLYDVATSITPPAKTNPSSSSASITGPILSSSSIWSTWSASPGGVDVVQDPLSSINTTLSTFQAWNVDGHDIQDSNDTTAEKLRNSPLPWLREFSSLFRKYHAMLKVLPSFNGTLSK
ncbi:hypothetical protein EDB19DRAFT_1832236 [Suillus lakei]|nr:hypothetical protein EDB19DRAFT_1832236 [Suillus lakei]